MSELIKKKLVEAGYDGDKAMHYLVSVDLAATCSKVMGAMLERMLGEAEEKPEAFIKRCREIPSPRKEKLLLEWETVKKIE